MPFPGNQDDGRRPGSGWFSMLLVALFFLAAGTMMVWGPEAFWSGGGIGTGIRTPTMAVYGQEAVPMLGWIAICSSTFFFAVAWRIYRGK